MEELVQKVADLIENDGYWLLRLQIQGLSDRKKIVITIDTTSFTRPVTLEDCVRVSRSIDSEVESLMGDQAFDLEVTSPGERRPLRTLDQRLMAVGKEVEINLEEKQLVDGVERRKVIGTLNKVEETQAEITEKGKDHSVIIKFDGKESVIELRQFEFREVLGEDKPKKKKKKK